MVTAYSFTVTAINGARNRGPALKRLQRFCTAADRTVPGIPGYRDGHWRRRRCHSDLDGSDV